MLNLFQHLFCYLIQKTAQLASFFDCGFLPTSDYIEERKKSVKPYENLWFHIWRGSMPELSDESIEWEPFYRSYIRTYLDRDVADLINAKNLVKFHNFMQCIAARVGDLAGLLSDEMI